MTLFVGTLKFITGTNDISNNVALYLHVFLFYHMELRLGLM